MREVAIRVLRRAGVLQAVNSSMILRVGGQRVRVPILCGVALSGIPEPWMRRLLEHFLATTDGSFVDVGVNVGQTLVQVKTIDPLRPYIGFEPNPVCVAYVRELIDRNGFESCTIVPAALHHADGPLLLDCYARYAADGTASTVPGFRAPRAPLRQVCVAAYRYETAMAGLPPVRLGVVKIDVEGAELDVLLGLESAIRAQRPALLMEILPVYDASHGERLRRQEGVEDLLRRWDYDLLRVRKDRRVFAGLEAVGRIGIHSDLDRCDYVAVPREARGAWRVDGLLHPLPAAT